MIVKTKIDFLDCHTNQMHRADDEFEVSFSRYQELIFNGIDVEPIYIEYRGKKKKSGPKIIIYQKLLYRIGGIETWDFNLAKTFENKNITFVFSSADRIQFVELSKYANVLIDNGDRKYKCDVLINANYDGSKILLDRVEANKIYQAIHSDFKALEKVCGWHNFVMDIDQRTDKIFAASETAQKGLKERFGYDSVVIPNILAKADKEKPTIFITLSRASEEKGIGRCIELAKRFRQANKKFIWLLCTTISDNDYESNRQRIEAIRNMPEFIQVQPQLYTRELLKIADYLCQFSDTEAYCYSIREALQQSVPVLATPFTEAQKIIKDGENGYLIDFDLSNVDVEKIFNQIPKFNGYNEEISPLWEDLLGGKL